MKTQPIRCTEANAPEFRALIQAWPELSALVRHTQAQGVFPGLRGMTAHLPADRPARGAVAAFAAQLAASQPAQGGRDAL